MSKYLQQILLAFLLISFENKQVSGVKCYVCQSFSNPACGDIFTMSEESDDFVSNCKTSCFKFTVSRGDNRDISRGCLPSNKILPYCKKDTIGDLYGTFCACNDDFCNGTTTPYGQCQCYIWAILVFCYLLLLF